MKFLFTTLILLSLTIHESFAQRKTDTLLVKKHFSNIIGKTHRNEANLYELNRVADYIKSIFEKYTDSVSYQTFKVSGIPYKNVIASFGTQYSERLVIGAHYDVCGNQDGADDNASGVAALLELARLLDSSNLNKRIDLVAYTLEEPPYFDTENMGSFIHAKSLKDMNANVLGMISIEMIGFFKDEAMSQKLPHPSLKYIYGDKGNFITLVSKLNPGHFTRKTMRKFKRSKKVKTKVFKAPTSVIGIDLSDHKNYWQFGYSAFMITDTSFYRNPHYHRKTDTIETLDLFRMAKTIDAIFYAIGGR